MTRFIHYTKIDNKDSEWVYITDDTESDASDFIPLSIYEVVTDEEHNFEMPATFPMNMAFEAHR